MHPDGPSQTRGGRGSDGGSDDVDDGRDDGERSSAAETWEEGEAVATEATTGSLEVLALELLPLFEACLFSWGEFAGAGGLDVDGGDDDFEETGDLTCSATEATASPEAPRG